MKCLPFKAATTPKVNKYLYIQTNHPFKRWTQKKNKEKVDHMVFIDRQYYEKMLEKVPKLSKCITESQVVDIFKVVGSIAKQILGELVERGDIVRVESHGKQDIYRSCWDVV